MIGMWQSRMPILRIYCAGRELVNIYMELMELLKTRRTYRKFDETRKIPDDAVEDIVRAQQYASCGNNRQPLRYIVVSDEKLVNEIFEITKWAASLPDDQGRPKEGERPTMFVAVLEDNSLINAVTGTDVGLAISNMTLAAWSHGIGSCIIFNVNKDKLSAILDIDEGYTAACVVAFGYPVHKSIIKEAGRDESLSYYINEDGDYVVPKRRIEDTVIFR